MRPGGSGTVGYNLYAYATNDPVTWVDPSGHEAAAIQPAIGAMLIAVIRAIPGLCTLGPVALWICVGVAIVSVGLVAMALVSLVLDCSSVPGCLDELLDDWDLIKKLGSVALGGLAAWTISRLANAAVDFPEEPRPAGYCSRRVFDRGGTATVSHVIPDHFADALGNPPPGKSYFFNKYRMQIPLLMGWAALFGTPPVPSGDNCLRHAAYPDPVGFYRGVGATSIYAVVTESNGQLVTMHPGFADVWP